MTARKNASLRLTHPLVLTVIVVRTLAALYILVDPFWGLIATLAFDYFDSYILLHKMNYTRVMYHMVDKPLDMVTYMVELFVAWQYGLFFPMALLFAYRSIGQIIFSYRHDTRIFIPFPNFFEVAFFWFIAMKPFQPMLHLSVRQYWEIFFLLCGVKIIHEIALHFVGPIVMRHFRYPAFLRALGYHNTGMG